MTINYFVIESERRFMEKVSQPSIASCSHIKDNRHIDSKFHSSVGNDSTVKMIKVLILFLSVASSLGLDGDSIRAQNATISDRDELFTVIDLNKRRLSSTTASIGTFLPLDCNSELSSADCGTNKVSTIIVGGAPLTIPCGGECLFLYLLLYQP